MVPRIPASALQQDLRDHRAALQEALTRTLEPYWEEPTRLQQLTGFSWWVEAVGVSKHGKNGAAAGLQRPLR